MGKLLDEIHSVPPDEAGGARCKVGVYLDTLPTEDADDLRSALVTKIGDKYAAAARRIAHAMSLSGHPLSASLINEHRARLCRCYRKVAVDG